MYICTVLTFCKNSLNVALNVHVYTTVPVRLGIEAPTSAIQCMNINFVNLATPTCSQLMANDCPHRLRKKSTISGRSEDCFLSLIVQRRREMAMLFHPEGEPIHVPCPILCDHIAKPIACSDTTLLPLPKSQHW